MESQTRERSPNARIYEDTMVPIEELESIPVYTREKKSKRID